VALAAEDWQVEKTVEVLAMIALQSHVTGCLPGGSANAHYFRRIDIRSNVVDFQSYYSYRIP
jgi:hypothetical protein